MLLFWLFGNCLLVWYAHDLNRHELFGFPGGFWVAAQGALLVYLALVVAFAALVNGMERRYLAEIDADHPGSQPDAQR